MKNVIEDKVKSKKSKIKKKGQLRINLGNISFK